MLDQSEKLLSDALNGLLSDQECRSLQTRSEDWRGWFIVVGLVLVLAAGVMGFYILARSVLTGFWFWIVLFLGAAAFARVFPFVEVWREKQTLRRIMSCLATMGIRPHLCLNCEYDLKGSTSDHCPECGTALAPVVEEENEASPRL